MPRAVCKGEVVAHHFFGKDLGESLLHIGGNNLVSQSFTGNFLGGGRASYRVYIYLSSASRSQCARFAPAS